MKNSDTIKQAIGIDVGGTKVKIANISKTGDISWSRKQPVVREGFKPFVRQLARLIEEALTQLEGEGCAGIGIALPAVIDREHNRVIQSPNLPFLDGSNLGKHLQKHLAKLRKGLSLNQELPLTLGFDGTASAVAEAWQGQGRDYDNLITVVIGTGVGGGIITEGRVVYGHNNVAGALGWMPLDSTSRDREMSRDREQPLNFEEYCAGPGIARRVRRLLDEVDDGRISGSRFRRNTDREESHRADRGESLQNVDKRESQRNADRGEFHRNVDKGESHRPTDKREPHLSRQTEDGKISLPRLIFDRAEAGEPRALDFVQDLTRKTGIYISALVSILNPGVVIFGGSVGLRFQPYLGIMEEVVRETAQPVAGSSVQLHCSRLGDDAGVMGAAGFILFE
ncbi:MAG: ROK family protein [Bacillota bacterium]